MNIYIYIYTVFKQNTSSIPYENKCMFLSGCWIYRANNPSSLNKFYVKYINSKHLTKNFYYYLNHMKDCRNIDGKLD